MIEQLETLFNDALVSLQAAKTGSDLQAWRVRFLGSKGEIKKAMQSMRDLSPSDRPVFGEKINEIKLNLQNAYDLAEVSLQEKTNEPAIDITEPGLTNSHGQRHVICKTIDEILDLFGRMGFDPMIGSELEFFLFNQTYEEIHNNNYTNFKEASWYIED